MIEIIFRSNGGQGVLVATRLLADAASGSGRGTQSFAECGGERRGGKVESFPCFSGKKHPVYSNIYKPDYIIVKNESPAQDPAVVSDAGYGAGTLINSNLPWNKWLCSGTG